MRLPSLPVLLEESRASFARFSFVIIIALIGTVAAVLRFDEMQGNRFMENLLTRLELTALAGIPLLIALTVGAERLALRASRKAALLWGGIALLALYFFSLPARPEDAPIAYLVRTQALIFALHALVSIAPFSRQGEVSPFWEYNKTLFLRLLTAALYTLVLWIGLSVALLAVDKLFGVVIPGRRYGQIFLILAGLFNTWFFLGGIPRDVAALDAERAYPRGLRVFTQFVLIPLVMIYLVILYAYSVKIIIDWDWPKGWVSYLVLGFSITGIFSILLVHPLSARTEERFIRLFSRQYYRVLLPLTVLLFLAVWRRIGEYGITERRYYVLVLALWLAGIVLYFLISRRKSIKVIPASLCAVALLTTFGPWGAVGMSQRSQMARLEETLARHGLLVDGKVRQVESAVIPVSDTTQPDTAGAAPLADAARSEMPLAEAKKISSILRHITEVNGIDPLQPFFSVPLDTLAAGPGKNRLQEQTDKAKAIAALMGVRYVEEWEASSQEARYFSAAQGRSLQVAGYGAMVRLRPVALSQPRYALVVDGEQWSAFQEVRTHRLVIARPGTPPDSVVFDLDAFARRLAEDRGLPLQGELPLERLTLDGAGKTMRLRLAFRTFSLLGSRDSVYYAGGEADLLIGH